MNAYRVLVALAGTVSILHLDFLYPHMPWWISAVIGYSCATPIGFVLAERRKRRADAG